MLPRQSSSERIAADMTCKALAFGATNPEPEAAREVAAALAQEAVTRALDDPDVQEGGPVRGR